MPPSAGNYDFFVNPDDTKTSYGLISRQVPPGARVLDLGCAAGALGAALMETRGCRVVGIEMDVDAAASARQKGLEVHVADLATVDLGALLDRRRFDRIICADILEHLVDPEAALSRIVPLLEDGGAIIASIPNISHIDVQLMLAADRWEYVPAGLLDRTHLRFFTVAGIRRLAEGCGLRITSLEAVHLPLLHTEIWDRTPPPGSPPRVLQTWQTLVARRNPNHTVYQHIAVLEPQGGPVGAAAQRAAHSGMVPGKLNIVVRTIAGRSLLLRDALYSIAALTYPAVSAIVVVHSDDAGYVEEVRGLVDRLCGLVAAEVVVVDDMSRKRGHPLNVGLDAADGEYVSFLDDDDVLYPHFADVLIRELVARPEVSAAYGMCVRCTGRTTRHGFVPDAKAVGYAEAFNRARMFFENYIPNNSLVYRRADLVAAGILFDETLDVLEDWDLLRRLCRWHEFSYVPVALSEYRTRDDGAHSFAPEHQEVWERCRRIIRERTATMPLAMTEGELRELFVAFHAEHDRLQNDVRTECARADSATARLEETGAQLQALQRSPVLRIYRAVRRTGVHVPLRAAYRLAARVRRMSRRLRSA
jgi:methionine biosynthesis protein MetW